jgi:1,6-anhydro-N-acetylmuramate kinase
LPAAARAIHFNDNAEARLSRTMVEMANDAGWSTDALEAQAFAHLAVRTLN